jgi:hypothetical protein
MACGWRCTVRKPVIVSICCGVIKVGMTGVQQRQVEKKSESAFEIKNIKIKDDDASMAEQLMESICIYKYISIYVSNVCIYRHRKEKRP